MSPRRRRLALVLLACIPVACDAQARPADDARPADALYAAGEYDAAAAKFAADTAASPAARRGLLRALAMRGRYDDAIRIGRPWAAGSEGRAVWTALGEALAARGEGAAAESLFARAAAPRGGAPDSLRAGVRLAELWWRRGERPRALAALDRYIDIYNASRARLTSEELAAVGAACRYLGERDPQLYKDALKAYDAAAAADPADPEPHVALAELFLAKYAAGDADASARDARKLAPAHPGALLAAARVAAFDGSDSAKVLVTRALAVNPRYADARVFLGALHLDTEDRDSAATEANAALAVDARSVEALAVLGAARLLAGDEAGFRDAERRALAIDPKPAAFYTTIAESAVRHRMYERAVALARQAVAADPQHWPAQAGLGLDLVRVGKADEARPVLERAFAGDPYNVWVKNTLDLLDTYKDYETVTTPNFAFMLDRKEAALLAPYLSAMMEDGFARMARRYAYRPPTPVRLEVFRSHADFSVRSVGLAGLGALGVSFGSVLAMDSPAARKAGEFNWGSTAWHELGHAFTLGKTGHRVPRWFSEGLSVYEERRARPGWGAGPTMGWLAAVAGGALRPVSRLNDGFVRPRFAEEVVLSYYHASLVCEMIEETWGASALVAMLDAYGQGRATDDVFRRVLKVEPAELDRRFDAWVKQRYATPLGAIRLAPAREGQRDGLPAIAPPSESPGANDLVGQLARGLRLADAKRDAEALPYLKLASGLFPTLSGPESPRLALAAIHERRGDARAAAAELDTLVANGEVPYDAWLVLARLREQLGDRRGAADALEQAVWVSPYDAEVHQRLAALREATGDHAKAVLARQSVVALAPVDRAEALYQLALAHEKAGNAAEARRAVLRALDEAPNFEKAQELLVRLRGGAR